MPLGQERANMQKKNFKKIRIFRGGAQWKPVYGEGRVAENVEGIECDKNIKKKILHDFCPLHPTRRRGKIEAIFFCLHKL